MADFAWKCNRWLALALFGAVLAVLAVLQVWHRERLWEVRLLGALVPSQPSVSPRPDSWSQLPPLKWKLGLNLKFQGHRLYFDPQGGLFLITKTHRQSVRLMRRLSDQSHLQVHWHSSGSFEMRVAVRAVARPVAANLVYLCDGLPQPARSHSFPLVQGSGRVDDFSQKTPVCIGQAPVAVASSLESGLKRHSSLESRRLGVSGVPEMLQSISMERAQRVEVAYRLAQSDDEGQSSPAPVTDLIPRTLGELNQLPSDGLLQRLVVLGGPGLDSSNSLGRLCRQMLDSRLRSFERLGIGIPLSMPTDESGTTNTEAEFPTD